MGQSTMYDRPSGSTSARSRATAAARTFASLATKPTSNTANTANAQSSHRYTRSTDNTPFTFCMARITLLSAFKSAMLNENRFTARSLPARQFASSMLIPFLENMFPTSAKIPSRFAR